VVYAMSLSNRIIEQSNELGSYFPDVLELARQLINTSVRRLEYEEIRRLLYRSMGTAN
jgi:hypothetical protein